MSVTGAGAHAVLFDYGGVLGEVAKPPGGVDSVADHMIGLLQRLDCGLTRDDVAVDLALGMAAYEAFKRAQSRMLEPREITHCEFWQFVTCDWPAAARAVVDVNATPLTQRLESATIRRPAREDAVDTLTALRAAGIRTALVSNCLSGAAARDELARDHLHDLLDVSLFSDEIGLRKPGAGILLRALEALGVAPEHAWFVGDRIDRDILAARRAGVSKAILISTRAGSGTALRGVEPDVRIDQLAQLLPLARALPLGTAG